MSRTRPVKWQRRIRGPTRSYQSQNFDNVFYGIPFELEHDVTKSKILNAISNSCVCEDQVKIARKLFKNNGLDLYNSVIIDEVAEDLIRQVEQESFFKKCLEVPSSEEDSPLSIEVETPSQILDREKRKKQNRAKNLSKQTSTGQVLQTQPIHTHKATDLATRIHRVDVWLENTRGLKAFKHSAVQEEDSQLSIEVETLSKILDREERKKNTAKNSSKKRVKNNSVETVDDKNKKVHFEDIYEISSVTVTSESSSEHNSEETVLEQGIFDNTWKRKAANYRIPAHHKRTLVRSANQIENLKKRRVDIMSEYTQQQNYQHPLTNGEPFGNVATLFNMGNTCFLNSVLYTLRFAPTFLHNLHHLLVDLTLINTKLKENKTKTSSLGRNGNAVSGNSWRSASSKDLLSIGNDIIPKTKDQIVTEKLHALFVTMNNLETKDSPDSYQPEALLQAIRDANSIFEGNHQQDAHEFFVELLSCLRVTCDKLNEQIEQYPELIKVPEATTTNNSKIWGVRRSWKKPLKKKEKLGSKKSKQLENEESATESDTDNLSTDECGDSNKKKFGYNFIAEDFQGVSLHRTKCLECEEVSELKEPFLEIQVPVNSRDDDFDYDGTESCIFGSVCVTSEKLCDQNKYFCGNCNRYNEALRTVLYEKLPNIMVLHLKRFTTSSSGVQKVTTFVPTPLEIRCFCETCNKSDRSKTAPHRYRLSCVIMHLGASMASGHYIAYSRASIQPDDYIDCTRDIPKNYLNSSSKEISANFLKFFKTKTLGSSLSENQNGLGPHSKKNDTLVCQSKNCCGIRSKLNLGAADWLEFDDEKVKTLSTKEFVNILNRRQESTNTPYLLFYSKV